MTVGTEVRYRQPVSAVVPDELIRDRRRLGLGDRDEMWEGALRLVSVAPALHGMVWNDLRCLLASPAERLGLSSFMKPGVFDADLADMANYRVPDLGYARAEDVSERGIEGRAVLVVEVLSPEDGSYEKLPFYRRVGVEELLYVDPKTRAFEVRRPEDDGWRLVAPDDEGWMRLASLEVGIRRSGDVLQIRTGDGIEEV